MEEMVGRWWHQAVTKLAQRSHPQAIVHLKDVQKTMGILFRSGWLCDPATGPGC
jgi:nitric oxide reductase NorD protein